MADPHGTDFNDLRAMFQSICEDAHLPQSQDTMETLHGPDLKELIIAFLLAAETFPDTDQIPLDTKTRRWLENSLEIDDIFIDNIKLLMKPYLDDNTKDCTTLDEADNTLLDKYKLDRFSGSAGKVDDGQHDQKDGADRNLFHSLDHPSFDIRASFHAFLNDTQKSIDDRCAQWALPVCKALKSLSFEMRFAVNLQRFEEWDGDILKDALEALRYSIFDFLGPFALVLRHYCNTKKDQKCPRVEDKEMSVSFETYGEIGELCAQCLLETELALVSLTLLH